MRGLILSIALVFSTASYAETSFEDFQREALAETQIEYNERETLISYQGNLFQVRRAMLFDLRSNRIFFHGTPAETMYHRLPYSSLKQNSEGNYKHFGNMICYENALAMDPADPKRRFVRQYQCTVELMPF